MHQVVIGIQELDHERATLEAREVTKLHYRDSTSSNDEFSSYIYIPKERRCLNVSTKGDRQEQNRLSLFFHLSPAILPSTNAREVYFVNHKISLTVL